MILVCFLTIVVLMIILQFIRKNEAFSQLYLANTTRCFDCEKQLPKGYQWMGQPTKLFSTEAELASIDPRLGVYGGKTRCFSCLRQLQADDTLPAVAARNPNIIDASWRYPGSYVI